MKIAFLSLTHSINIVVIILVTYLFYGFYLIMAIVIFNNVCYRCCYCYYYIHLIPIYMYMYVCMCIYICIYVCVCIYVIKKYKTPLLK